MSITFHVATKVFHLIAGECSYLLQVSPDGFLMHLHWGTLQREFTPEFLPQASEKAFAIHPDPENRAFNFDAVLQEFPVRGGLDLRQGALRVLLKDGGRVVDLRYDRHRIVLGKPELDGLPGALVGSGCETLEIELVDRASGLCVVLSYTVFDDSSVIVRSTRITNCGSERVVLRRVMGATVEFWDSNFELLQLSGAWARERKPFRRPLYPGAQGVDSQRGISSHQHNPFVALVRPETSEDHGECFAFLHSYSGNFTAQVDVAELGSCRVSVGLNDDDFTWNLEPGMTFQSPEVFLAHSKSGLTALSHSLHDFIRHHVIRSPWGPIPRPVLINSWEAMYFDFDRDKLVKLARGAAQLGVELLVVDDGWFGRRNNDKTSLGDWFADPAKFPEGLPSVAQAIKHEGLLFGLWFEPEMVSRRSTLFKEHPDWCLQVPGRATAESRSQLVLDLSRADVCDWIIETVGKLIEEVGIDYIKWDMNRPLSHVGSLLLPADRQGEVAHRYVLGLYRVMKTLTERFPQVLFEGCSGGGGRFDAGILAYMPQIWVSDDTDALERCRIQYGTSFCYPYSVMGCHISAVPNHQTGRTTPLNTRAIVAKPGCFGLELDPDKLDETDRAEIQSHVAEYKTRRKDYLDSRVYRLTNPHVDDWAGWVCIRQDGSEAILTLVRLRKVPNSPLRILRLAGLEPERLYKLDGRGPISGAQLMDVGYPMPDVSEFEGQEIVLTRID